MVVYYLMIDGILTSNIPKYANISTTNKCVVATFLIFALNSDYIGRLS